MTKKELIDAVAAKTGVSKKDAGAVVDAALNEIVTALANDDAVQIAGFGTFETRKREARTGDQSEDKREDRCSRNNRSCVQGWQGSQGCREVNHIPKMRVAEDLFPHRLR